MSIFVGIATADRRRSERDVGGTRSPARGTHDGEEPRTRLSRGTHIDRLGRFKGNMLALVALTTGRLPSAAHP